MRKLFLRSTLTYLFLLCLAFLCALPVSLKSLESVRLAELARQRAILLTGVETVEAAVLSFHSTSQILLNDSELSAVAVLGKDMQAKDLLLARIAQKRFRDILMLVSVQSYSAIVFHQSGIVIDPVRIYASNASYYSFFFKMGDLSIEGWQQWLHQEGNPLYPETDLSIFERQPGPYLLYKIPLVFSSHAKATLFLCIAKADIAKLMVSPELVKTGSLTFIQEGKPYLSMGQTQGNQDILEAEVPLLGMRVSVGLQPEVYQRSYMTLQQTMLSSALILLMFGFLLSLVFAYRYIRPVRRLLGQIASGRGEGKQKDVYLYIESTIRNMDISMAKFTKRIDDMIAILHHNDFDQALCGNPQMPGAQLNGWLGPLSRGFYRLMLVDLKPDGGSESEAGYSLASAKTQLEGLLPEGSFQHVLSDRHIITLLPAREGEEVDCELTKRLNQTFSKKACIILSYPFTGIEAMPDIFWELRQSISSAEGQGIVQLCGKRGTDWPHLDFGKLQRISYILSTGSFVGLREVMKQMDVEGQVRDMNRLDGKVYFECLCAILRTVAVSQNVPLDEDLAYDESTSLPSQLEGWIHSAEVLCHKIGDLKKPNAKQAKADVQAYVDRHFSDPQLCIDFLAQHFSMKPKQVSAVFFDQTGRHYSDYVEDMRMREAVRQIEETDLPIQEIAAAVGFATFNTFYKAFRRRFCCSPGTWRQEKQAKM